MKISSADISWIKGGDSHTGTARPEIPNDGEHPVRRVRLQSFGIARTTTSNAEFARFVADAGYVTDAERLNWSFVFSGLLAPGDRMRPPGLPWWEAVDGASWAKPTGPGSTWEDIPDHPAVHVSWNDAMAYARWAGGRLPTEAEWEHAARGGAVAVRYPWGDEEPDNDNAGFCNIWQGRFPDHNTEADGYYGTAPVRSFPPNAFGLFNMSGNVWEWCGDPFRIRSISTAARKRNQEARAEGERVLKGGSFLCHASYCWRYRIAARSGRQPDNGASHCGFRLAFDVERPFERNTGLDATSAP